MEPESAEDTKQRCLTLIESVGQEIVAESHKSTKNICYLVISHGTYIAQIQNIFHLIKHGRGLAPASFVPRLSSKRRMMAQAYLANMDPEIKNPVFASISAFKLESVKEGLEVVFRNHFSHLKKMAAQTSNTDGKAKGTDKSLKRPFRLDISQKPPKPR